MGSMYDHAVKILRLCFRCHLWSNVRVSNKIVGVFMFYLTAVGYCHLFLSLASMPVASEQCCLKSINQILFLYSFLWWSQKAEAFLKIRLPSGMYFYVCYVSE